MTAVEALMAARSAGIQISVDGDDLVLESASEPPVAVVDLLTEHKAGILTILRSGEAAWPAEDGQVYCDERAAIAEFEGPTDHPCHAITGSAATGIPGSADLTGSASAAITGSAAAVSATAAASTPIIAPRRPLGGEWSTDDWLTFFDERAAIAEFDCHLPRPQAYRRVFAFCVPVWLFPNPTYSSPDRCLICEKSAKTDDPLLAIGVVGAGQAWLHGDCVSAWHSARLAAAVAALSGMNIVAAPGSRGRRSGPTSQMR